MQRVSAESESRERERVSAETVRWTWTRMGAFGPGADLSKAQQSCVPATAPRTHVIKQQSDGDAMIKIDEKWIKNQSQIN